MVRLTVLRWHARGAAAMWEHISLMVIAFPLVRAKKLVSVEDAPSTPLRGEDKYPRMLMSLGLMEKNFDGDSNEKFGH